MKLRYFAPLAPFSGICFVLACGTDPVGSLPGTAGSGGASASGSPGTAGQSVAGSVSNTTGGVAGTAGTAATSAGSGGVAGALGSGGTGGSGGVAGAGGAGGTGGGAGAGGAGGGASDGWVKIFNGQDLTGWVPLIHKSAYNVDTYKTFRADPVNHVLKVTYEDYPDQNFDDRCGVLYYDKVLKDYRVRVTYRFLEPQAKNPVSWGKNNTGLMIFGIAPSKVMNDPEFPPLIEIQLLGTPSGGGSTNINLCTPGGMTMTKGQGSCGNNGTGVPAPAAAEWVTVEAEVHVNGDTKVYQYPDKTKAVLTISGPMYQGKPVTEGYLSLQSESQPLEYKDIELMELP
jgi:hypothetical protein